MMRLMSRKLAVLSAGLGYFLVSVSRVFAQTPTPNPGNITIHRPDIGFSDISTFINAAIRLAFIIALIAVLVMLVWGAVAWIFSGGDKEAVAGARNRIIHALVGFAILAIAVALASFAGQFVGIDIFKQGGFTIPNPNNPEPSLH